jgi:DNA-binding response OmpR family regulator
LDLRTTTMNSRIKHRGKIIVITAHKKTDLYLSRHLMENDFEVFHINGLREASVRIFRTPPHLIIVDIATEETSLFDTMTKTRGVFPGPLILLADGGGEPSHILALELGADDFIVRPFSPLLLSAKIDAVLRRSGADDKVNNAATIAMGGLHIDAARRDVHLHGRAIRLTIVEFDLLWYLARNAGTAVSRNEIQRSVFMREYNGIERSIDMYISRLRKRLGDNPSEPRMLKTVRGTGYLLCDIVQPGYYSCSAMN